MSEAIHASLDGRLMEPAAAHISVLDEGLLRGDGAFEVVKLYAGHPFRLGAHLERLARSTESIELDFDAAALEIEIAALLAADRADNDRLLRIVLTRGGRRIVLLEEIPRWPPSARISLITLSPSEILGGVKSISYAANMQATRIARNRDADEAVFVKAGGIVLEAPTSSIFWAGSDGRLHTPSLETGILDSITRRVVVEAIDCEQGAFTVADLEAADEAFLASTTREIQPISAVDGRALPAPSGGPGAARAAQALSAAVQAERRAAYAARANER